MPQIARTTNDVIVNSLYLIGELGTNETPDSFMLSTGLDIINELLDKFSSDSIYIPFLTTLKHRFIVGKPTYSISDIVFGTDIRADRVVDLSFANYEVPGAGIYQHGNPISFNFIADLTTNTLTFANTEAFPTGTPIVIETYGSIPLPLIAGVTYYTIWMSPSTVRLAHSEEQALYGNYIRLTTDGIPINVITTFKGIYEHRVTALVYPMRIINKAEYYGVVRQNNLLARPGFIFLDKQAQESFITVYPAPDQPYPFQIQVKSMINELNAQQSLGELPPNYYGFLKYAVGREFKAYYPSSNWPQENEDSYQDYYTALKNSNETDLTIRPSVIITAPEPFYWPNILSY
jgi:hypothetical protein